MPRSELAGLFQMMRTAPQGHSIAEMRANLATFIPFINANAPEVARVDAGVPVAAGVSADIIVPPGTLPFSHIDPSPRRRLVEKLRAAGRQATLHRYEAMPHGFVQLPVTEATEAIATACQFVKAVTR